MANACAQHVWENPNLGGYLKCILLGGETSIFTPITIIAAVAAVIMTIMLINQTLKSLDNPQELAKIGRKWVWLFVFVIVITSWMGIVFFGAGLLGFEKSSITGMLEELLNVLDNSGN